MNTPQTPDRTSLIDLTLQMAWNLDHQEWDAMPPLFTDEVRLDYTSLNGGEPATVPQAAMIERWRESRENLKATQHLLSNHLVRMDGGNPTATAMFQATHVLPNDFGSPIWTLGGEYRYEFLEQGGAWRISALTMRIIWADGNRNIRDLRKVST